jgi:DNA-binding CsgD family transcriptional regulator
MVVPAAAFFIAVVRYSQRALPGKSLAMSLKLQYIIAYSSAYVMGAYLPYYFYKGFGLDEIKFYATRGVLLFILGPFLVFNVVLYTLDDHLLDKQQWAAASSAVYGLWLLAVIFRAVIRKYKRNDDWEELVEAVAVWVAVLPWEAMSLLAFFSAPQWLKMSLANLGWIVITVFRLVRTIKRDRQANKEAGRQIAGMSQDEFVANCLHFGLTRTEILVIQWLYRGKSNKEIGEIMHSSEETVKKHIQNAFRKVGVKNRLGLIHKLLNRRG